MLCEKCKNVIKKERTGSPLECKVGDILYQRIKGQYSDVYYLFYKIIKKLSKSLKIQELDRIQSNFRKDNHLIYCDVKPDKENFRQNTKPYYIKIDGSPNKSCGFNFAYRVYSDEMKFVECEDLSV
jgi:hypothetical protein